MRNESRSRRLSVAKIKCKEGSVTDKNKLETGRGKRRIWLLAIVCLLSYCSYKQSAPVKGQLLDAVDRSPIADAFIIAAWHIDGNNWHAAGDGVPLVYRETLTNTDGYFKINRWFSFSLKNIL